MTTGTWPSPWWLHIGDSIWRGEMDVAIAPGSGTLRQRWITYRDGIVYKRIVKRGPLFPLNSVMLHGILYGDIAEPSLLDVDADDETSR